MTRTRTSPWGAVAAVLALLALAAAAYAVWSAREVEQRSAREAAVVDSLREEVAVLRASLSVPPDTIAPLPDTSGVPGTAAPAPPATQTTPRQP